MKQLEHNTRVYSQFNMKLFDIDKCFRPEKEKFFEKAAVVKESFMGNLTLKRIWMGQGENIPRERVLLYQRQKWR